MKSSSVNEYLKQYYSARAVKRDLDRRYHDLSGRSARLAEVAEQIEAQRAEMVRALQNVMDMVDLLPLWSMERTVVELRRIDCKPWAQVARDVCMGRSRVIDYYNAALQVLADNEQAQALAGGWGVSRVLPGDKIAAGQGKPGIFSHEERKNQPVTLRNLDHPRILSP